MSTDSTAAAPAHASLITEIKADAEALLAKVQAAGNTVKPEVAAALKTIEAGLVSTGEKLAVLVAKPTLSAAEQAAAKAEAQLIADAPQLAATIAAYVLSAAKAAGPAIAAAAASA